MARTIKLLGATGSKGKRPLEFKIAALANMRECGAKEAIQKAGEAFDQSLPESYTTRAGSHKAAWIKQVGKLVDKNDEEAVRLCEAYDIEFEFSGTDKKEEEVKEEKQEVKDEEQIEECETETTDQ